MANTKKEVKAFGTYISYQEMVKFMETLEWHYRHSNDPNLKAVINKIDKEIKEEDEACRKQPRDLRHSWS